MFIKSDLTPENLSKVLEKVRNGFLCAYTCQPCDCKYGADKIGGHGEQGNGCPEVSVIIKLLESMHQDEFIKILNRRSDSIFV